MILHFIISQFPIILCQVCDLNLQAKVLPINSTPAQFQQEIIEEENIGFGIWFKWQPNVFSNNLCDDGLGQVQSYFLYMVQLQDGPNILKLNLDDYLNCDCQCESNLINWKIESEFFMFQGEFRLLQIQLEGVWIFFYTFLDFISNEAKFIFYQPLIQEQKVINIQQNLQLQGTLKHIVGGCLNNNTNDVGRQFRGRTTIVIYGQQPLSIDELLNCIPQDCTEQTMNLINSQAFFGTKYEIFETEILEKQIYQLSGWFQLNFTQLFDSNTIIQIFKITSSNLENSELSLAYNILDSIQISLCSNSQLCSKECRIQEDFNFFYLFQQWHYLQLDVGNPRNTAILQIYSHFTQKEITIQINDACQYTGEQNFLFIGGDSYSLQFFTGIIINLQYRAFCNLFEYSFIPKCHFSCKSCFGPFFDNCITCYDNNIFYNNKCICKGKTNGQVKDENCLTMSKAFEIVQEKEEEIKQVNHGYFDAEGNIICSYGFFTYKNYCVKWQKHKLFLSPYFDLQQLNIHILCLDCYLNPNKFYIQPKCSLDAISFFQNEENTYEIIERMETEIDYYEIIEIESDEYELKLLFGSINQNGSIICKNGYFQQNDQCKPCSFACILCVNDFYCNQCQLGYYLNQQYYCEKCLNCDECEFKNNQVNCLKCPDKYYLNQDKKCTECGKFCANCNSNGFCNYCIDTKKYFISLLNGMDCQICGIENCETCYDQILQDGRIQRNFTTYFNFSEPNFNNIVTRCSKCNPGFTLTQAFSDDDTMEWELCDDTNYQETQCLYNFFDLIYNYNICYYYSWDHGNKINCLEGRINNCVKCVTGYYSDFETNNCMPCSTSCESCVQFYKDILPILPQLQGYFSQEYKNYMISILPANLLIKCITCKNGYLLYKDQCVKDCGEGCLQCEIINYKATCIKCDVQNGFQKSLDADNQCQICSPNCAACRKRDSSDIKSINKYFIQTTNNEKQTQFCFYKNDTKDQQVYFFLNHYVVDECKEFKRCKSIFSLQWNLYCDINQFELLQENNDNEFIENYYIQDFFDKNIINQIETDLFINYLNDNLFTQIEINLNIIQDNAEDCKFSALNILKSNLFSQVLLLQNLYLKIFSLNISLLSSFILQLSGFTQITFENLQIQFLRIILTEDYIKQINIYNCQIVKISIPTEQDLQLNSAKALAVNIQNFTIQNVNYINQVIFKCQVSQSNQGISNININNLKILNSSFQNSSLYQIYIDDSNQNISAKMTNISIINTNFSNSNLISSEGGTRLFVQNMYFENFSFANMFLVNSQLFSLNNILKIDFNQFSIVDTQFLDGSYFLLSNNIQCQNFLFRNITINYSFLISNQVDLFYQTNLNGQVYINLFQFRLEQINYNSFQSILQVIKYSDCENSLNITLFQLYEASYQLNYFKNFISQESALIHIECQQCNFDSILIERSNGVPEISIVNSERIRITNSVFTQSKKQKQILEQSGTGCFQKSNRIQQFYYLYIGFYTEIIFDNLQILESIVYNQPYIIIEGTNIMSKQVIENIEIKNSIFQNNIMIISQSNSASSLIQAKTDQQSNFLIQNSQFYFNHLNAYISDLTILCSTTILIQIQIGTISINNCQFSNNIITNSTNSILYLKAEKVNIQNTIFYQSNFLNFSLLIKHVLFEENVKEINVQGLSQAFQIYSKGGSGYILANNIYFINISVNSSSSQQGGAFYIDSFGDSLITLKNSTFYNSQASLLSSLKINSLGGCFYIDAQLSNLTLIIKNTTFDTTLSRKKGGAFYIIPSCSQNYMAFSNIQINNCFSIQSSFFDFSSQNCQTLLSNFYFTRIFISQTQQGLKYFLSQLNQFSSNESIYMLNQNPLFYIDSGNLILQKLELFSQVGIFLIQVDQAQNISIADLIVKNGSIASSPLLKIHIDAGYSRLVEFVNFRILNLAEVSYQQTTKICQNQNLPSAVIFDCLNPVFDQVNQIILIDTTEEIKNNQLICNTQTLYSTEKLNYSLIEITNINRIHFIYFRQVVLESVSCINCQYGLIILRNIELNEQTNIEFNEISIKNCFCNQISCLTIIQNDNQDNFESTLTNLNRIMQQQNYNQIVQKLNRQVILKDCQFISNIAKYGGGICVIGIDILILNNNFVNNTAEVGGAIYYENNNTELLLLQSQIVNNTAQIAGGLFLYQSSFQENQKLDVIVDHNNSTNSGSDILEKPRSLGISIDTGKTILQKKSISTTSDKIVEQVIIKPYSILGYQQRVQTLVFPSGQKIGSYSYFDFSLFSKINYNLSFRILTLNKFQQKVKTLDETVCTLSYKIINNTNEEEIQNLTASISQSKVNFDTSTNDFNLDNLIIQFNPYYLKEVVLRLSIGCDCIGIPIEENSPPFLIKQTIKNYHIQVDIKTFPCQLGEYFNSTVGICIQCEPSQNQYQVKINATQCLYKDDLKINSMKSQVIQLKQNYWRAHYYSTKIEDCLHLQENCLGGWFPGDASCTLGHIGALCEQCDIYNIRGDGKFAIKKLYQCGNCDKIVGNIISIFIIYIWTVITVFMSVNSNIETVQQFLAGSYLIAFGLRYINKRSSTAVLIKIFTNYSQIVQTILTFQLKIPEILFSLFHTVGNPIEQMIYSLDCFLTTLSDIPIIYFRIIWSLFMFGSYIQIFLLVLTIAIFFDKIKFNISMITTVLIYMFIYSQPNLIQYLIQLVSFRIISEVAWISGNVSYRYDTSEHKIWLLSFCFPLLIIFSCVIPGYMFYKLRSQKKQLDFMKFRELWGYLYNEYAIKAYYWEFVKILQKECIIIVLSYYEDYIQIKAILIFLVIYAYSYLATQVSPYQTGELNKLDLQSTTICGISIILGGAVYSAQTFNLNELIYPFYSIIIVLNIFFFFKVILKIIYAYLTLYHEYTDKIKDKLASKFKEQLKIYPQLASILESNKTKETRIKSNFQKVRKFLVQEARKHIKQKKSTSIDTEQYNMFLMNTQIHTLRETNQIMQSLKQETLPVSNTDR